MLHVTHLIVSDTHENTIAIVDNPPSLNLRGQAPHN